MTQVELAAKLGITQAYLSILENGKSKPDSDIINKLSEALEISPYVLIGMDETYFKDAINQTVKNLTVNQLEKILEYSKMIKKCGGREKI